MKSIKIIKIGIGIICHVRDLDFLYGCLSSIAKIRTEKEILTYILLNKGEKPLAELRKDCYNALFDLGCDVVLSCDADFQLFPSILEEVTSQNIVSFMPLCKKLYDFTFIGYALVFPNNAWSGCFLIPKHIWKNVVEKQYSTGEIGGRFLKNLGLKWKVSLMKYGKLV